MRQLFTQFTGRLRAALARRPGYAAADLALFSIDIRV